MRIGRGETNHLFVDVDGTLLIWSAPGRPGAPTEEQRRNLRRYLAGYTAHADLLPSANERLITQVKAWHAASDGWLVIWSMGGPEHADCARRFCGFGYNRVHCIGKPDLAIDDNPAVWGKGAVLVAAPDDFKVPA